MITPSTQDQDALIAALDIDGPNDAYDNMSGALINIEHRVIERVYGTAFMCDHTCLRTLKRVHEQIGKAKELGLKSRQPHMTDECGAMSSAPKDGTPVLLKVKDVLPRADDRMAGVWFVGRNVLGKDGYDYGWNFAAPVGYGGIPDEWLDGWKRLDRLCLTKAGGG